ncbi:MAG: CPBP family intramembrane metalloprotease [Lachnospiraceae bacterium]|jgi:membrane protease YdiL (CAAX protease family)|nr:CPBP family intramembrane metalloprotease [Lachnospiraceae bacterium]
MKKTLLLLILELTFIQGTRIISKKLFFSFFEQTLIVDTMFSILFMAIATLVLLQISKKEQLDLKLFPSKFTKPYFVFSFLVAVMLGATPIITKSTALYDVLSLIYGALVTPIFEEALFRGFVWTRLEKYGERFAYFSVTILFTLWHIGYIDTIIWRAGLFNSTASIPQIMFWKVVTGCIYGIALGAIRYKTKNTYSSMLLHAFMNTFGR